MQTMFAATSNRYPYMEIRRLSPSAITLYPLCGDLFHFDSPEGFDLGKKTDKRVEISRTNERPQNKIRDNTAENRAKSLHYDKDIDS